MNILMRYKKTVSVHLMNEKAKNKKKKKKANSNNNIYIHLFHHLIPIILYSEI